jgi:hypothetical protein
MRCCSATAILNICNPEDELNPPSHLTDNLLETLRAAALADTQYVDLVVTVESGIAVDRARTPVHVRQLWSNRKDLSVDNGIALYGSRIFVHMVARQDILKKLHAAHQGIVRTKRRAQQTVY